MKNQFIYIILLVTTSCAIQKNTAAYSVSIIETHLTSPYVYTNELQTKPIQEKLLSNIQSLSENKTIASFVPKERLATKIELMKKCNETTNATCSYVGESYKILSNVDKVLNVMYSYNAYGGKDEYYKYASFDLTNQEQLTYYTLFTKPNIVLKMYNKKYNDEIKKYIITLATKPDDKEEYELYKDHLDSRDLFELQDLNNYELRYNSSKTVLEVIRFHYNGMGGMYRIYFQPGYVDFSISDVKPYLTKEFQKKIK